MRILLVAALLLPGSARAEEAGGAALPPDRGIFYDGTHFGVRLDGGLPSGGVIALVGRPWRFLRLDAGMGYDAAAFDIQGGATLVPFHWWVTPTLGFSGGRFFEGDASRFARGASPAAQTLLSRFGYDYLSADLGLELGGQNRFVFYVRAGLAYLRPRLRNVNQALQAANPSVRITTSDPALSARIPSARIGFLVYLF
jgi:hypothetical protein